jgi:hypothetical protein
MDQFPHNIWVNHYGHFDFSENSRLKVHHRCQRHRWQMKKILKQNNFNTFVWAPLGSWVNHCRRCRWYRWQFATDVVDTGGNWRRYRWHRWQIYHRCQQHKGNWWKNLPPVSLIPVANLPPVSLIPVAIYHRCHWHRWQICHRCRWHRWCTLTCEYLREFSKKIKMILMLFSGAWGKNRVCFFL